MLLGLALGLCAAFFQSCSYLGSRWFVGRYPGGSVRLLALGHVWMGAVSVVLAAAFWPKEMPAFGTFSLSLLGTVAFYLLGQMCLFLALRHTDASRVSPLLGLKVLILALMSTAFLDAHYSVGQWAAVGLSILAAVMLAQSGGAIARDSLLWALAACVPYCLSDMNIKLLVGDFSAMGLLGSSVFATAISYILCGLIGGALLAVLPRANKRQWRDAMPFATAWLISMLFLYACFGQIGVVFGNILQSTRGIQSILMGAVVAHLGMITLERKVARGAMLERIGAAVLMTAAIALFYLG
jgi:uncharacterized membrane protein